MRHYVQLFATVESTNAFYRLPERETFEKWRERHTGGPLGGQGQPVPRPHQRAAEAGGQVDGRSAPPGWPRSWTRSCCSCADAEGRSQPAVRLFHPVPGRHEDGRRAPPRELVKRPDPPLLERYGVTLC
ncbi:DUF72 domain-containing protein [Blastococcus saxobsidens]|uniref:DUF72 domain-containing protein n=1 Tax=Blastococcus saxobsidens (strain DD2) TaxID=1146883 RepID=H6RRK6_BLASD|nr:protein of unknown function [Blastococcus saxobsidens DD2]